MSRFAADLPAHMRILVTGTSSIHGWPVFELLRKLVPSERLFGIRPPKMNVPEGDNVRSVCITARGELEQIRNAFEPTHVIHAAGVCDLDVCESRPQWAHELNVGGASAVVDIFGSQCYVMFLSSDLVFSGDNPPGTGYDETHEPDPVSVAGKTFALAERQIARCTRYAIIRLGLPLGRSVTGTKGAEDWVNHRLRRDLPVTLFHDEIRSCIECDTLAQATVTLLSKEAIGLYHLGGSEPISLHEMGRRVLQRGNHDPQLLNGISRHEEIEGPPRIGDVTLNSTKIKKALF